MKRPPRFYILDADHHVVPTNDMLVWARFFEGTKRLVAMTDITSAIMVSTVFIGIDHRYFGEGPPLLFETMIFGGPLNQSQWRYASWDDAETGHKAAVRKARQASK